jgi:hypothetical protein
MDKLKRSWRLLGASVRLVRANRSLVVFPIVSGAAAVTYMCLIFGGGSAFFGSSDQFGAAIHQHVTLYLVVLIAMSAPLSLVVTFCQSALVGCILMQMEGKPHGWRDGMRLAWAKRRAIAGWSLIGPIGWLLIVPLERAFTRVPILGPYAGKLLLLAMGIAWSLVTFLIIPVMVFEEQPNLWARLRRSEELFKRTWGEQIVGRGSLILFMYAIFAIIIVPMLVADHLGLLTVPMMHAMVFAMVAGVIPLLSAFAGAIYGIYSAACYSYAVTGMLPQEFSAELLRPSKEA